MAVGCGSWLWQLAVAAGCGSWLWQLALVRAPCRLVSLVCLNARPQTLMAMAEAYSAHCELHPDTLVQYLGCYSIRLPLVRPAGFKHTHRCGFRANPRVPYPFTRFAGPTSPFPTNPPRTHWDCEHRKLSLHSLHSSHPSQPLQPLHPMRIESIGRFRRAACCGRCVVASRPILPHGRTLARSTSS